MLLCGCPELTSEVFTCETELFEVILPRDGAVCDAVYEWAEDGTSTCLVDTEDVWTWSGRRWRVVCIRLCERRRGCGWNVHVSRDGQPQGC